MKIKEVIGLSLKEITIRSNNKFTMQCYNTVTEISSHQMHTLVIFKIICYKIKYRDQSKIVQNNYLQQN